MKDLLKSYLRKLTNLSGNNKSLLLLRLSLEQDIDLHEFDYIQEKSSFEIINQLIGGKNKIILSDVIDSRNEKINLLSNRLKKIERRDKFIFEERGAKDLYIGWPFVRGKFIDGTPVRCPLLFFPVSLEAQKGQWILSLRKDVNLFFNKSFLLAYAHFNKVKLKDKFIDKTFENFSTDSRVFRTSLYELLKDSPIEINFNQEIFLDKLFPFEVFKKNDYEEKIKTGELKLFPEAVLGIFPQADSYLVPDYDFLLENDATEDLEDFFLSRTPFESGRGNNSTHSNKIKEENTFTPFQLDASQENVVHAVKWGKSMMVQGPPGTGKSQLICNLIADFIARDKKVLLVCQKKAALDVVYQRLKEKELNDSIGLVHDFKNDRKKIFSLLNEQIEKLEENKTKNNTLNSIFLEKNFFQVCRRIDQITEELEEFKAALFDSSECGISIKELYLTSSPDKPFIDLKQEYKYYNQGKISSFTHILSSYLPYSIKFERLDYIWKDRIPFGNYGFSELKELNNLIDFVPYYQAELSEKVRKLMSASLDLEDMEWIADRENLIRELLSLLENKKTYENFTHLLNKEIDENKILIWEKQIKECYRGEGLELTLEKNQLEDFRVALEKAFRAKKKFPKWLWWRLFSKDKIFVQHVFVKNKLQWDSQSFEKIIQRIDNRMNLEHPLTKLSETGWFKNIPLDYNLKNFEEWIHHQYEALAAKAKLNELRNLKDLFNFQSLSYEELKFKLLELLSILKTLLKEKKRWNKFLMPTQISKLVTNYSYAVELKEQLKSDFESLVEFDRIKASLKTHDTAVIEKISKKEPANTDSSILLFLNSIHLHWIDHIELKYPILRAVSSLKMEQLEKELENGIVEKLKLSKEIVLQNLREKTYKDTSFNRLNNMVSYRELRHQVSKKKKIWPLRRLIAEHSEEIFNVLPCWLASPESVSAIFPMEQLFDLVIFDEASQCYAEKGIPAIYRGKQIVVTGDDKQLPPNDLYNIRWEEETTETTDMEIDSLLNLSQKYLNPALLSGHYRSKSLDLIEFSNTHFYKGRLKMLPDFDVVQSQSLGIEYVKVDGLWENNINIVEAEKVVQLVMKINEEHPAKSIGIVTFNYKQQNYIQDLLEEYFTEYHHSIPDKLFIKNIENVQGDERDIIIFSIGYARDAKGKLIMNFGSLNQQGGENRLNVAVTRAREKNYIICSLTPSELKVEDAKNEGPRLLKEYLQYAWNISSRNFKPFLQSNKNFNNSWLLHEQISSGLKEDLLVLKQEFPFADLSVKKNNDYKGLLLTDDQIYYEGISVKESHAYVTMNMREKKWKYKKVFSRQYWEKREEVKSEIKKFFS